MDEELLRLKRIDLIAYATTQGYVVDRRESSKRSVVLRRDSDDDKIIVTSGRNGISIYFSVRDDADRGTIIDFVQRRTGYNLGAVRAELRRWLGAHPAAARATSQPEGRGASDFDRVAISRTLAGMRVCREHAYLVTRGISPRTQADERFCGRVLEDERGNAVFPHWDLEGWCGFEVRNRAFRGFSAGGRKGAWVTSQWEEAPEVVIVESAIDALSHAQLVAAGKLEANAKAAYLSTGGAMGFRQRQVVRDFLARARGRIVVATDNDPAGDRLAAEIAQLVPGREVTRARPEHPEHKDWNDVVRGQKCRKEGLSR
jgi:5S rRNA maturation endonuclease (ribonuclease M5)